jgi:hypothetical protein
LIGTATVPIREIREIREIRGKILAKECVVACGQGKNRKEELT